MTPTDNTSKRIDDCLEELLFGEHDDERKAIQEAKSLIMELIAKEVEDLKDGIEKIHAEVVEQDWTANFKDGYGAALRDLRLDVKDRLEQLQKGKL